MSRRQDAARWIKLLKMGYTTSEIAESEVLKRDIITSAINNYYGPVGEVLGKPRNMKLRVEERQEKYYQTYFSKTWDVERFFKERLGILKCR